MRRANLAAVLVDEVGKARPFSEVQAGIKRLDAAKFIRNTEEGWKLQTAQEKNWTNERSGYLDPKPRERNELTRAALQQIFDEPEFKTYRYQNRSFRVGINVDGSNIGDEGELPLTLCVSDDADELTKRIDDMHRLSSNLCRLRAPSVFRRKLGFGPWSAYGFAPPPSPLDRFPLNPRDIPTENIPGRGATKGHESQAIARLGPSLRARERLSLASSRRLIPGRQPLRGKRIKTPRANR